MIPLVGPIFNIREPMASYDDSCLFRGITQGLKLETFMDFHGFFGVQVGVFFGRMDDFSKSHLPGDSK